jgi:chorismate mutase
MDANEQLKIFRKEIDFFDKMIVEALLQRKKHSRRIQRFKEKWGLPKQDLEREHQLTESLVRGRCQDDQVFLKEVYVTILKSCRKK